LWEKPAGRGPAAGSRDSFTFVDESEVLYQPFPLPGRARAHIWRYTPENRRPRPFHAEPELNLVAAGRGKFGVGRAEISVEAGDLLWWPPGQDHELLEDSPDFDLFVIGVTPALSERVLGAGSTSAGGGAARLRLAPERLARFQVLCAAPVQGRESSVVERHIGDFWREAHDLRVSAPDMHALTRRVLMSLLERPELRRAEVAHLVRGTPSEVSRYFHRDVGLTLTKYRTRLRLLRFIEAADEGAPSLLSAAGDAGFGSYSQCHRAFHRTFGCTPRVFFGSGVRHRMRDAYSPWTR
jgi:AraC-like DNA-binding protein